jgi:hypothetical protein
MLNQSISQTLDKYYLIAANQPIRIVQAANGFFEATFRYKWLCPIFFAFIFTVFIHRKMEKGNWILTIMVFLFTWLALRYMGFGVI